MVSSSISCIGQHQCWKCLFAIPWIFFSWLICLWFLNFKLLLIHYLGVSGVINVPPGLFPLHPAGLMFLLDNLIHITVLAIYSFPQQMLIICRSPITVLYTHRTAEYIHSSPLGCPIYLKLEVSEIWLSIFLLKHASPAASFLDQRFHQPTKQKSS